LASAIDERFGHGSTFWAQRIPAGVDHYRALEGGLRRADVLLVIVSQDWEKSRGSRREVSEALRLKTKVIPLMVSGVRRLPRILSRLNGLELRESQFSADFARLLEALERHLAS